MAASGSPGRASAASAPAVGDRPQGVGPSPVERVLFCDRLERREAGHRSKGRSLPGHLLQLMLAGRADHEVEGRRYTLETGHLIWYHEDEPVRVRVRDAPWRFYTLNFLAPALPPPAFEQRVHRAGPAIERGFAAVHAAWHDREAPESVRALRVHGAVHELLAALLGLLGGERPEPFGMRRDAELWWRLESAIREDLSRPVSLRRLAEWSGRSPATVARSCHAAVGEAPMQRVKRIRMSMARALVRGSALTMTEIAARLGYARPHELSRDYRRHFGRPPSHDREAPRTR